MAKTQNLSLNPTKISGTCGRLMCCLKYEQDAYEDLLRTAPKAESFVDTPEGRGTVTEVDLLRSRVKVRMEDSPETISVFRNEDIAILRSGKAKKSDPPIPADLAPISGNGKRVKKETAVEEKPLFEPIRFRYREEAVVDEPAEEVTETPADSKKPRRRNRKTRPAAENAAPKAQPEQEKQEEPAAPAEEKAKRPNRHRRHYRKPKSHKQGE
jgi:hypothetical protein